jgi:carlactone synthase/all-trans-10'-apo-beta-carotenal 13,14-cleaving dioxygenase
VYVGVVISIVSAAGGDGYVLVLDATTFQEIARVRFPYGLPYGFHGCWIPDKDLTPGRFDGTAQVN